MTTTTTFCTRTRSSSSSSCNHVRCCCIERRRRRHRSRSRRRRRRRRPESSSSSLMVLCIVVIAMAVSLSLSSSSSWRIPTVGCTSIGDSRGELPQQQQQQQQQQHENDKSKDVDETIEEEEEPLPLEGHFLAGGSDSTPSDTGAAAAADADADADAAAEPSSSSDYSCTCVDKSSSASTSNMDVSCRNRDDDRNRNHDDVRTTDCGARIFYFVGIHNHRTLQDAVPLFRAIRSPRNTVLFHLDTKLGMAVNGAYEKSFLRKEIEACPCGTHVEVMSVHNSTWGTWSMMLPTLWSMERAVVHHADQWDVYVNLSGDTLPVYTQSRMAHLFAGPLKNINFVTSAACETGLIPTPISAFPKHWHKRTHYSYHPPDDLEYKDDDGVVRHNVNVETYFGSQWMALTPKVCTWLVDQLQRPDSLPSVYRDYLIRTQKLMTDETFIPTMMMKFFPETMPNLTHDSEGDQSRLDSDEVTMYAIRYERMDEHVPTALTGYYPTEQRYEVPKSTGIESPRPWGPYFLGTYDLENIRTSGALFVRKVAQAVDANLYRILPVDTPNDIPPIGWPHEVKISPVPNWEKTVAAFKAQKAEKERQKKLQQQQQQQRQQKEASVEVEDEENLDTSEEEEEEEEEEDGDHE